MSFKLRNRNLTLALIFQKCQLKNFKSKSAKKTRKYFKIVTFGEWDDSDVTRPSAVLLSPYPAVRCLRMHMLRICQGCDVTFWNFKWAAVTATLPLFSVSFSASPPPPEVTQKAASKARPICRLRYLSSDFRFCIGFNSTAQNRLIGRLSWPPLLSPAINTSLFLSWANKCSRPAG